MSHVPKNVNGKSVGVGVLVEVHDPGMRWRTQPDAVNRQPEHLGFYCTWFNGICPRIDTVDAWGSPINFKAIACSKFNCTEHRINGNAVARPPRGVCQTVQRFDDNIVVLCGEEIGYNFGFCKGCIDRQMVKYRMLNNVHKTKNL
jgi:hypothetical protein